MRQRCKQYQTEKQWTCAMHWFNARMIFFEIWSKFVQWYHPITHINECSWTTMRCLLVDPLVLRSFCKCVAKSMHQIMKKKICTCCRERMVPFFVAVWRTEDLLWSYLRCSFATRNNKNFFSLAENMTNTLQWFFDFRLRLLISEVRSYLHISAILLNSIW